MPSSPEKEEDNAPSPSFVAAALPAVVLLVCTFSLFVFLWHCRWRRRCMGRSRSRYRRVRPCSGHCPRSSADGLHDDVEMGVLHATNGNDGCTRDRDRGAEDGGGELGFVDGEGGCRGYGSDEDDEEDEESEGFSDEASSESSTFALASESESESSEDGSSSSAVAIVRVSGDGKCRARTRRRSGTSGDGGERIRRRREVREKGALGVLDGFLDRVVERVVRFMDEGDERGGEEGVRRV